MPVSGPVAGTEPYRTCCPSLPSDISLSGSFPLLDSEGSLWLLFFVPGTKGSQRRRLPVSAAASRTKPRPAGALRPLPAARRAPGAPARTG